MSQQDQTAVISFPIRLVSEDGVDTEKKEFDEDAAIQEAIDNAVDESVDEAVQKATGKTTPQNEEALESLNEFLQTLDKQGLKKLAAFAKNPTVAVENEILGLLGKAGIPGAIAVAIIGLIIASPEIIKTIVKQLSVKGGPLNQDFHRFIDEENQVGFSRDLQYRRAVGLDVVITDDNRGYLLTDPAFVGNNLVDADKTRSQRLSSNETSYGYVNGM
jgi:hypothetical protein